MTELPGSGFTDRLMAAADAKRATLAKFKPKASVTDPLIASRAAMRAAELDKVRQARADAKAAKKQSIADAEEASRLAAAAIASAALEAKRGERKERKALTKAEQKAKRDARYAARKARK
jgi:hypothetical protein